MPDGAAIASCDGCGNDGMRDHAPGKGGGLCRSHLERHRSAKTFPGLTLFRFNAPLTFFNADYFKQRALAAVDAAGPDLQWFVIDAIPISDVDINGLYALRDLREALKARGAMLIIAGRRTEFLMWLREIGQYQPEHEQRLFPTLRQAMKAYSKAHPAELPPDEE